MHIIFGNVTLWQLVLMKLLRYFKFNVFYLHIDKKNSFKKHKIEEKLKTNNFLPISVEELEQITPDVSNIIAAADLQEASYKKSLKLVPDKILKKYCKLFSIDEQKREKVRLMLQQFISFRYRESAGSLDCWSRIHPLKKIFYVSFEFKTFYTPDIKNIYNIIIPLDFINFFKKIINKTLLIFMNNNKNNKIFNNNALKNFSDKTVAFVPHMGLIYGSKTYKVLDKSLYYSKNIDSPFNKYNILHLDYSNYPSPEENFCWVILNQLKIKKITILLNVLINSLKTLHLIKNWSTFLSWLFYIHAFYQYKKYFESIKKFKSLKIALIDYDSICPKPLILALENNNIRTIATQERPITSFFKSHTSVIVDTYYTASEQFSNIIKKSKYYDIQNIIPAGQYRTDYIKLYSKEEFIPESIIKAKKNGKKVITIFGYECRESWAEGAICYVLNWKAQISFLKECIKLSQNLHDTYIILRFKGLDWAKNSFFSKVLNEINNNENITISDYYKQPNYSYKLCANSDLIIARHTSIADECLCMGIPVLFHEYTHNVKKIVLNYENYLPSELICENFEELLEKSKIILFKDTSILKDKINELKRTLYHTEEKGNIKDIIHTKLENLLNEKDSKTPIV